MALIFLLRLHTYAHQNEAMLGHLRLVDLSGCKHSHRQCHCAEYLELTALKKRRSQEVSHWKVKGFTILE